jgi:hypothetical protein
MKNVRIALALLLGLWMLVDGAHALVTGTYITPSGGTYAGSLGPWATVLSAMQIDPLGTPAKLAFVLLGVIWLVHARNIIRNKIIRPAAIALCVLTLWYLPFGTIVAVLELIAEFVPPVNRSINRRKPS